MCWLIKLVFEKNPKAYYAEIQTLNSKNFDVHSDYNLEIKNIDENGVAEGLITNGDEILSPELVKIAPNMYQLVKLTQKMEGEE